MTSVVAGPSALPTTHVERCMGTVFSLRVPAPGVSGAVLASAMAWLHDMDAIFSTYRDDSDLMRIDAGALAECDARPEVRAVLAACEQLAEQTGGFFAPRPDGRHLDLNGYVKGWAVQGVAERLAAAGSSNHCVNGGGDVLCAGQPAPDRGWRVGISDPVRRGELLAVVEGVGPLAVATSGLAERGAHILDPHSGEPVSDVLSVTVVADDLVTADTYATAAAAMGAARGRRWLAEQAGVSALVVERDGTQHRVGDVRFRGV